MKFRLQAFALHLFGSATALLLVFGSLYLGWYRWPGWYLAGAQHVAPVVVGVDLALGPLVTLMIANPRKPRRELGRDISVIVAVQLVALSYGALTLWQGRPLFYTFSVNVLQMVQASELKPEELERARHENPAFVPHWYDLPRWVWAPLPSDPAEAAKIISGAVLGHGTDVTVMPRYYRSWQQGLPELAKQLRTIDKAPDLAPPQRRRFAARLAQLGISGTQPTLMTLLGHERPLLVVFDPATLKIRAILRAD
jgi:hypothetical protein